MSSCLTYEEFEAIARKQTSGSDDTAPSEHLRNCIACRTRLDEVRSNLLFFDDFLERATASLGLKTKLNGAIKSDSTVRDRAAGAPVIDGYGDFTEIARGGQGIVYKARQIATNRIVAVKILLQKEHRTSSRAVRFEREIDLVARLDHPNIAAVFDGGLTAEGRRFLVMRYIEGACLGESFANQPTSIDESLDVFEKICAAVSYAHMRGIIHRDLKPGNIRIASDGEPFVLDFGLAKMTASDGDDRETTRLTSPGEFMGTLAYAAPEQVTGRQDDIDTRADVYSLGLILYELLTRKRPYRTDGPIAEVIHNITQVSPTPPSSWRRKSGRSHSDPAIPRVDDELEAILLRSLEKDKSRRYQSVADLIEDLRRYRLGLPIAAKRHNSAYLLSKFVRRHRLSVAIAALFVLLITTSSATLTIMYGRETRARILSAQQSQRAETAEAAATVHARLLTETLDSMIAHGDDTQVGFLKSHLDEFAVRVKYDLADFPDLQAQTCDHISGLYRRIDLAAESECVLQWSLDIRRKHNLEEVSTLVSMIGALREQGRYCEAVAFAEQILKRVQAKRAPQTWETADAARRVKVLKEVCSMPVEARAELAEADRIIPRMSRFLDVGEEGRAASLAQALLAPREKHLGGRHAWTLVARAWVARKLALAGRLQEAEAVANQILEDRRALFGEAHPEVSSILSNLVDLARLREDYEAAADYQKQALDIERSLGRTNIPNFALNLNNLGVLLEQVLSYEESENVLRESLALHRELLLTKPLLVAQCMTNLARVVGKRGGLAESKALYMEAIDLERARLGDDASVANTIARVARLCRQMDDQAGAETYTSECLEMRHRIYADDPEKRRQNAQVAVEFFEKRGRPEAAAKWQARANS